MKIAFHINTLTKGGAERAVTNLAQAFTEFGHEVTIITSFKISQNIKFRSKFEELIYLTHIPSHFL